MKPKNTSKIPSDYVVWAQKLQRCVIDFGQSQSSAQIVGQDIRDGHGNRPVPGIPSQPASHLFPLAILDLVIRAGEFEDFVLCIRISSEAVDSIIAR